MVFFAVQLEVGAPWDERKFSNLQAPPQEQTINKNPNLDNVNKEE